ncbi:hypothetical protein TIFTF001_015455 [Ficus carica]|uniref:Uncharacterized protein n=1 Tax=Ficus carica TaxID=3494 RepID=A0AA88A5V3_FICCA|nr:hypothetical protein TIFTF001_015455 [Ficus carica]
MGSRRRVGRVATERWVMNGNGDLQVHEGDVGDSLWKPLTEKSKIHDGSPSSQCG